MKLKSSALVTICLAAGLSVSVSALAYPASPKTQGLVLAANEPASEVIEDGVVEEVSVEEIVDESAQPLEGMDEGFDLAAFEAEVRAACTEAADEDQIAIEQQATYIEDCVADRMAQDPSVESEAIEETVLETDLPNLDQGLVDSMETPAEPLDAPMGAE